MAEKKLKGTEKRLSIYKIEAARDVQPRAATDKAVVAEYAERLAAGDKFPPVEVYFDGEENHLAIGFHRLAAHEKAGRKQIDCVVHNGTKADAQWAAIQSNKDNGLRRTNEDKARAVTLALKHPNGKDLSSRQIAELVGVSPTMDDKYRPKDETTANGGQSKKRKGRDGRTTNVGNIGKGKKGNGIKAKPGTKPEAEKPTSPASAPGQVVLDEHTVDREVEPEVVQPEGAANGAADDLCSERELYLFTEDALGLDPECSKAVIDEIEADVAQVQESVGAILRTEEVAALSEMNHLWVLLKRLESAADNVASFLAHQRGLLEMSVPADIKEGDDNR